MKRRITLRMRITLLTGVVIAVVAIVLTAASMLNARQGLYGFSDVALQIIADDQPPAGIITDADSEGAPTLPLPRSVLDDETKLTPDRKALMMQAEKDVRQNFNLLSIICLLGAVTVGMAAAYLLAGRALTPVHQLSKAAGEISSNNMHLRLEPSSVPDDIGTLINTFNSMLDRLENAFESQKRFSSNVAHELKTPLATMKMSFQVAQLENNDPNNAAFFIAAERSIDRLSGVVACLLALTDESPIELCDEVNPSVLLRKIRDDLQPPYADKKLSVETVFEAEDITVSGNLRLAHQLFYNLVENAMKYTPPEGTIWLSTRYSADVLRIMISDNGPGIPVDALEHIFEPFFCVDPSRSRKLGGAGLGLSIARMVAQRHGWTLEAENASTGGAVFTITIPAKQIYF
ncbi:ATP-binding protein [Hungatella hathewayi]|uniref:ATP-binding protein n=1 Tax=Hungatella hathewayi TaxID=154046 RepID=UPI003563F961